MLASFDIVKNNVNLVCFSFHIIFLYIHGTIMVTIFVNEYR